VNIALAGLFLLFAANLFGWFELSLPWRVLTAADRVGREAPQGSSLGALIMGATFTLTSVTCTAPFVGTLLVLAAQGSWLTPVVGMIVYSTAFALPFVLLALSPRLITRLPRSGEWLHTLRVLIGVLEVAAAIKFISNTDLVLHWGVFTRDTVLIIWTTLAVIAAGYLAQRGIRKRRGLALQSMLPVFIALWVAFWLWTGLHTPLSQIEAFLPPHIQTAGITSTNFAASEWTLNDYEAALSQARRTGKFVFVDFTGYTCTNCRWMEANIFNRPDVGAKLSEFVLARLYTDGDGPIYQRQQQFQEKTFGTVALPLYAVVDANGNVKSTLSGLTRDPAAFIAFLRQADARRVASATIR
jgi:thiol:disulfide interchange protein DsbD